jgi:hypothetical protein
MTFLGLPGTVWLVLATWAIAFVALIVYVLALAVQVVADFAHEKSRTGMRR